MTMLEASSHVMPAWAGAGAGIYFQKNIHFIPNYLPDSKRLQSTTNV
jgi:hypothetical protein